jgi:hypothetical protein
MMGDAGYPDFVDFLRNGPRDWDDDEEDDGDMMVPA